MMWKTVRWWALAGFVVPIFVYVDAEVRGGGTPLSVLLWPAGFFTMAIHETSWLSAAVILILIASNVVLYSVLGLIWWLVVHRVRW